MVGALTEAGVLEKVCQVYKVFVEASYVERIRAEISAYEESQKLAERLRKLEIHLSEGFDKGLYAGVSVEAKQAEITKSAENDDDLLKEPSTNGLLELLQLKPVEKSYVWIDDRNVNSFSTANGTPIVTVTDVLAKLRETGILSDEEYFAKLLLLRAGNFRYLPLRRDEIIYHLGQAKIIDGETVETDALGILRRYTAACLLDEGVLQKTPPPGVPNANGEINFALEMTSAVTDALIDTWAKEEDVGAALNSPVVQSLRSQRAQVSGQLAELNSRYGPKYPDIVKAQQQLADIDAQIKAEIHRVISNLQATAQVSAGRLTSLEGTLNQSRGTLATDTRSQAGLTREYYAPLAGG